MAESENRTEWFSDDEFWTQYAPLMFNSERWAEVPAVVEGIISLTGVKPGSAVLDSCCGPGRHGLEFARRGYKLTGVDITKAYLDAFSASAAGEALSVELIHEDVRKFVRPDAFSLALNLFTSFGYFETRAEDEAYLRQLYISLKPGAALVMDMVGKETAARDFIEGEWFEREGKLILTEFTVVGTWEGLRNRWVIVDGKRRIDRSWVQRLYSAHELAEALKLVGFSNIRLFGSMDGANYDNNAKSLVAIARK